MSTLAVFSFPQLPGMSFHCPFLFAHSVLLPFRFLRSFLLIPTSTTLMHCLSQICFFIYNCTHVCAVDFLEVTQHLVHPACSHGSLCTASMSRAHRSWYLHLHQSIPVLVPTQTFRNRLKSSKECNLTFWLLSLALNQ